MNQHISVMLADRSDLMLVGEWSALLNSDEFDIIASLATFPKLLEFASHFQPQVIILDEGLEPTKNIYDMFNLLQTDCFQAKIIVMGTLMDGLYIRDLFHLGISGYLFRADSLIKNLSTAVKTVMRNYKYLSPTANAEYLTAMQSSGRDWQLDHESRRVLQLLAQGKRSCEIADALQTNTRRVYFVRQKLRRRFGAQTNEQLISIASSEGFIYS